MIRTLSPTTRTASVLSTAILELFQFQRCEDRRGTDRLALPFLDIGSRALQTVDIAKGSAQMSRVGTSSIVGLLTLTSSIVEVLVA
jgi:hypothetical protein